MLLSSCFLLSSLSFVTLASITDAIQQHNDRSTLSSLSDLSDRALHLKRDGRPPSAYDFTWIKHYVAIGDSYAAGIGAGNALSGSGDADCSRYDLAYPLKLRSGLDLQQFEFLACSGHTSQDIRDNQIKNMADGSADLITVSAGGNDVGFMDILKACVYLATDQGSCDKAIKDATDKVQGMRNNVDAMLQDLSHKLADNGAIIYNKYAKFWNQDQNYCDDQTWSFFDPLGTGITGLKLSQANRQAMNELTLAVNSAIDSAIVSARSSTRESIPVYGAEWSGAVEGVQGRFCEDAAKSDPAGNDDILMFIRKNGISYNGKKRSVQPIPRYRPRSDAEAPNAAFSAELSPRGNQSQPQPQTKEVQQQQNTAATPDSIARVFHPSDMGHMTITAPCIGLLVYHRSKILNLDPVNPPQSCTKRPEPGDPICNSMKDGPWKATDKWVLRDAAYSAVNEFCKGGKQVAGAPDDELHDGKYWFQRTFFEKTVNELTLKVTFYENMELGFDECKLQFGSIVDNCDVPHDDVNPKNLKYGGTLNYHGGTNSGAVLEFNPSSSGSGSDPQKSCNDNDTPTFLVPDVLDQNINDFCNWVSTADQNDLNTLGPSQPSRTYNENSINKVILSLKWPLGGFRPTSGMCVAALSPLNKDCNIPQGDQNPHNKKHGGNMVTDKEYFWAIAPQTNNTVTDGWDKGGIALDKTEPGDHGQNGKLIDKPTLQDCLRTFETKGWTDGDDCEGMVTFYMNQSGGWNSPGDCYKSCSVGVSAQIDRGMKRTNCDEASGFSQCWFGYYVK